MKKLSTFVMVLVIVALIAVIAIGSTGFTNWDVKTWFNDWGNLSEIKQSEASGENSDSIFPYLYSINQVNAESAAEIMRKTVKLPYVFENTQGQTFGIVLTYETEFGLDDYTLIYFGNYEDGIYDYYDSFEAIDSCTLVLNDNAFSIIGNDEHFYYVANAGTDEYIVIRNIFEADGFDKYTVKFDSNGGIENFPDMNVDYYTIASPLPVPTREDCEFIGWFYDKACTRKYDGDPITSNITLYAGWRNTYNQIVYTNTRSCSTAGKLQGFNWLSSNSSNYDSFEYILSYSVVETTDTIVGAVISEQDCGDNVPFMFMFNSIEIGTDDEEFTYGTICKQLIFGEYHPVQYDYKYRKAEGTLTDTLYFIINNKSAYMSYNGVVINDSGTITENVEITLFEFKSDSEEYRLIFNFLLGGKAGLDTADSNLTETLNLYTTMEIPTKEGYTFIGWFYDEACTQKYNGEPITSDTNLYAGWEINRYTVLFDCSVLEDPNDSNTIGAYNQIIEFEYGEIAECTPNVEIEGKTFLGWFFEDGTKYENSIVKSDMVLYGRWGVKEYTVTFDLDGGLYDDKDFIDSISVSHGECISLPIPVKVGYKFIGWSMSGLNGPYCDEEWAITEDMHLTAHWQRNVFTVTFYVDNEVYKQIQVQEGQTLGNVISDMDLDIKRVVGYSNLNEETAASPIKDFQIIDDMAVFLRDVQLENNVEDLKGKIVAFFEKNWIIIVSALGGVAVLALVIASIIIIVRRKR
ncbi:MAG: InlB B-repeat-containing protein [Clostridia bacterium]|nr:InlB B-repeat-containing protein [Clostridia bacterium]